MKPVVDRLTKEYAGTVDVLTMDLSGSNANAEKLANDLGVEYVPTFFFVAPDGTVRDTVVGGMTEADMRKKLDALK